MKEITAEMLQELENNEEFNAKKEAAKNPQEVMTIMKEYGIAVPAGNGELDESALDAVAGGGWLWDWFKSWFDKQSKKNTEDLNRILKR